MFQRSYRAEQQSRPPRCAPAPFQLEKHIPICLSLHLVFTGICHSLAMAKENLSTFWQTVRGAQA